MNGTKVGSPVLWKMFPVQPQRVALNGKPAMPAQIAIECCANSIANAKKKVRKAQSV